MQKYKSHKVVEAAPIHQFTSAGTTLMVSVIERAIGTDRLRHIKVPKDFFARGEPKIGDYLVRYEPDGYLSWSPKDKFEAGYRLVDENGEGDEPAAASLPPSFGSTVDAVVQRADILLALEAALVLLGRNEPGDGRAVSDQFVCMAAALAGKLNTEGRAILHNILIKDKQEQAQREAHAADPQQSGG